MKILHERFKSDATSTLSLLFVDGVFQAFSVEDAYRERKIRGQSRIPSGEYHVALRDEGAMTQRYASMFGAVHKGMLHIQDVPSFTNVYYHIGNSHRNTEGCPLVATTLDKDTGFGGKSTPAYKAFYAKVVAAAAEGSLTTRIVDRDREYLSAYGITYAGYGSY